MSDSNDPTLPGHMKGFKNLFLSDEDVIPDTPVIKKPPRRRNAASSTVTRETRNNTDPGDDNLGDMKHVKKCITRKQVKETARESAMAKFKRNRNRDNKPGGILAAFSRQNSNSNSDSDISLSAGKETSFKSLKRKENHSEFQQTMDSQNEFVLVKKSRRATTAKRKKNINPFRGLFDSDSSCEENEKIKNVPGRKFSNIIHISSDSDSDVELLPLSVLKEKGCSNTHISSNHHTSSVVNVTLSDCETDILVLQPKDIFSKDAAKNKSVSDSEVVPLQYLKENQSKQSASIDKKKLRLAQRNLEFRKTDTRTTNISGYNKRNADKNYAEHVTDSDSDNKSDIFDFPISPKGYGTLTKHLRSKKKDSLTQESLPDTMLDQRTIAVSVGFGESSTGTAADADVQLNRTDCLTTEHSNNITNNIASKSSVIEVGLKGKWKNGTVNSNPAVSMEIDIIGDEPLICLYPHSVDNDHTHNGASSNNVDICIDTSINSTGMDNSCDISIARNNIKKRSTDTEVEIDGADNDCIPMVHQTESDEVMARKLQEQMDREFAESIASGVIQSPAIKTNSSANSSSFVLNDGTAGVRNQAHVSHSESEAAGRPSREHRSHTGQLQHASDMTDINRRLIAEGHDLGMLMRIGNFTEHEWEAHRAAWRNEPTPSPRGRHRRQAPEQSPVNNIDPEVVNYLEEFEQRQIQEQTDRELAELIASGEVQSPITHVNNRANRSSVSGTRMQNQDGPNPWVSELDHDLGMLMRIGSLTSHEWEVHRTLFHDLPIPTSPLNRRRRRGRRARGIPEERPVAIDQDILNYLGGYEHRQAMNPGRRSRGARGFGRNRGWSPAPSNGNDYEDLLQLADALGTVKQGGLCQRQINQLPDRKYTKATNAIGENQECSVCFCEYVEDENIRMLPCFHEFHSACIDKWIKSNPTCPICRKEVKV